MVAGQRLAARMVGRKVRDRGALSLRSFETPGRDIPPSSRAKLSLLVLRHLCPWWGRVASLPVMSIRSMLAAVEVERVRRFPAWTPHAASFRGDAAGVVESRRAGSLEGDARKPLLRNLPLPIIGCRASRNAWTRAEERRRFISRC